MNESAPPRRLAVGQLERVLRARRDRGGHSLVIYLTGGFPGWQDMVRAAVAAGADAVEVGIPFSDPVMDGPVIQEASEVALRAGATPPGVLAEIANLDIGVPVAVMTYYNLVFRFGLERFASTAAEVGVSAAILPDLPLDEAGPWCDAADAAGISVARIRTLAPQTLVGVGLGVSNGAQAATVAGFADAVIVGSAFIKPMLAAEDSGDAGDLSGVRDVLADLVAGIRR